MHPNPLFRLFQPGKTLQSPDRNFCQTMIELKQDAKYALVIPTSMGTRLTPVDGQPFH
jgi:hypothetical protein